MNAQTVSADVEHQTNRYGDQIGHRIAVATDELLEIFQKASVGDSLTVKYVSADGLDVDVSGEITEVDREFNQIRFRGGYCYLHVHESGQYHFSDHRRKSPEDGHEIRSVTVRSEG